ncbi:MAG: 50S ribosomal protein L29 [Planctomycetes bacterium]|nr:50S ribosomal protein L29 [Planctomycetota bacterium]
MSVKKLELEELRGKPDTDLNKELINLREELFRLRYGAVAESLENTKEIRGKRKRIARIKTLLQQNATRPEGVPASAEATPAASEG